MKITAGLGSIDEYERFVQAGADEFFCGYVPFSWAEGVYSNPTFAWSEPDAGRGQKDY